MSFKERIIAALHLPVLIPKEPPHREEARRFLKSEEAKTVPLRKFEERFGIRQTDNGTKMQGYPKSAYYRPEDHRELERHKKATDEYLGDDA